jgi:hypothetical protein
MSEYKIHQVLWEGYKGITAFHFDFNTQEVGKVPLQLGASCQWFLLRFGDDFSVQYTGPNPDEKLLGGQISGTLLLVDNAGSR